MADQLILIIEDNERNLKLVRDVLQFNGFRTAEARTAEEGLALARSRAPDLVLLDLQLPGIDGLEAFRQLRKSPPTADTPVVAVTAFAMKDDRERVLRAGFNGYLEKPISVRELPHQVRAFLTGGEPNHER
jgi:two-component system, cell cycle response regulator DivK